VTLGASLARLWRTGGPTLVLGRALRVVSDELVAVSAPRVFRRRVSGISTLEQAVSFVVDVQFEHYDMRVRAMQIPEEIGALLSTLEAQQPKRIIEIGTAEGGTLFLFTRAAASNATLVSLDLEGKGFGVSYPARNRRLYRAFARGDQTVHLVRGDSHDPSTLHRVGALAEGPVDLLFIDGDHSYDGVKSDFLDYSPLVRPGGIVALHDIVPASEERVGGVPRYWAELKASHPEAEEYVRSWSQPGYGIGVIRIPEQP
jgi:predicted O-methyltransferase YrrM